MNTEFASSLSAQLQSHEDFWRDLDLLQAQGVRRSIEHASLAEASESSASLRKLLYCASVFAQSSEENHRSLAQTIALSAVLAFHENDVQLRTKNILADIGNFPALQYLTKRYRTEGASLLEELKFDLLRSLNSIHVGQRELALTDFQLDIWRSLPESRLTSISAPPSAGKSFLIVEFLCGRALMMDSFTGIYIAPTRALLAEIHRRITNRLSEHPEVRISTVPSLDTEGRRRQIFVLTQERLHVLLSVADINPDLVIVDEAQNLSDGHRGMILQDCLERIRKQRPDARLLFLSPGAEGFENIPDVIGLEKIDVKDTNLGLVLQNRLEVRVVKGQSKQLELVLLGSKGAVPIGVLDTERGVADPATRLAAVALELGKHGSSLVYATGPVDAERTATQLASDLLKCSSDRLVSLSKFIKEHIHPEYMLAELVLHSVAFHYGNMPTLLREALEEAFRKGDIRFLVCTTTLFQGINLPARNVFIDTPTRGRGARLDSAQLWNFAGRAGRLGADLVGNVFLVDYDKWPERSLTSRTKYRVVSALSETVQDHFSEVLDALSGTLKKKTRDQTSDSVQSAAGLVMAHASDSDVFTSKNRLPRLSNVQRSQLRDTAAQAVSTIMLPSRILQDNWTVDLHGLQRLAETMRRKIDEGNTDDLIPIHPREENAYARYNMIFGRIARDVLGMGRTAYPPYGGFIANYALLWMRGIPYPVLLNKWINYHKTKQKAKSKATVSDFVRTGFDFFESVLRFQMVQLGKAYLDVLHFIFGVTGQEPRRKEIFDFALALELGVSSTSGRAFIELGVSRIAAVVLEGLFPDSDLTTSQARQKLLNLDLKAVRLSPIIISELRQLKLIEE